MLARSRKEVAETIILKCYDWNIRDDNLNGIIDTICQLIEIYLTRTIDNKERESYSATFKETSSIVQNERKHNPLNFTGGAYVN